MERYLTAKATKGRWWDIPVLGVSGMLTLASISVIVTDRASFATQPVITALADLVVLGLVSLPIVRYLLRRRDQSQAQAIAKCLAQCDQSSLTFGALGRRTGVSNAGARLKKLMGKGYLQNIHVDDVRDMVRLDLPADTPAPVMDTGNADFNETLRQIRDLNDRIDHLAVSEKIDRIEDLTGGIFKLITDHPEKARDARRFISYYLPTTMKLLESYSLLEKQRYQGENITASRRQIEGLLDTMIQAIERQQDKMFRDDALDVETDIKVLETLLASDGLTGTELKI